MGLSYIGKIIEIEPIENADRIVQSTVVCGPGGKWKGVTVKDQFVAGDVVEVYLQDAIVPDAERFSFLKKRNIKIAKLRGAYSECLIMPVDVSQFPLGTKVGDDITELAGVTKYEKPIPQGRWFNTKIVGPFPAFIPKTDEPNFQKYPSLVEALKGKPYSITQKLDGTSITLYRDYEGLYHVCSRNYEIENTGSFTPYLNFPEGYAVQMEWVGPGIQGNPLGLKENQGYVFNAFHFGISQPHYINQENLVGFAQAWNLNLVSIIEQGDSFNYSEDELRQRSVGFYTNGKPQEGIVVRPMTEEHIFTPDGLMRLSFKVINAEYKGD